MAFFQSYARYWYGRCGPLIVLNFWWSFFLFHMITRDSNDTHSWPVPYNVQHNTSYISPKELMGNPEAGSISCHSPLRPVFDRTVNQKSHRRIPKIIHVSMKSRCVPVCQLGVNWVRSSSFHLAYHNTYHCLTHIVTFYSSKICSRTRKNGNWPSPNIPFIFMMMMPLID
jgi:hypothetical protein